VETGDDCKRLTSNTTHTIMNARLFIITTSIVSFAQAQPFPVTPSLDGVVAAAIRERKAKAPHYAEGQTPASVQNTAQRIQAVPSMGLDIEAIPRSKPLPVIAPMSFDLFTLKLQFVWDKPHGQWMNQMLKDIEAAKAKGDIQTYNDLTARYSVWAEKYLRRRLTTND